MRARRDPAYANPRRQSHPPQKASGDRELTQATIAGLLRQHAFRIAHSDDPLDALAHVIKAVIASDADPYHLIGVLAEGTVETITRRIPGEQRRETTMALLQLILDRLQPGRAH
jgi:hypothetical protein